MIPASVDETFQLVRAVEMTKLIGKSATSNPGKRLSLIIASRSQSKKSKVT